MAKRKKLVAFRFDEQINKKLEMVARKLHTTKTKLVIEGAHKLIREFERTGTL